ncbi:hypothetical protein BGX38DRAFT_1146382 [Terfezia claveryi]|nr:hypothetical protein BGX38DRAFT_1146382 [Terfezia claveryi]
MSLDNANPYAAGNLYHNCAHQLPRLLNPIILYEPSDPRKDQAQGQNTEAHGQPRPEGRSNTLATQPTKARQGCYGAMAMHGTARARKGNNNIPHQGPRGSRLVRMDTGITNVTGPPSQDSDTQTQITEGCLQQECKRMREKERKVAGTGGGRVISGAGRHGSTTFTAGRGRATFSPREWYLLDDSVADLPNVWKTCRDRQPRSASLSAWRRNRTEMGELGGYR